MCYNDVLRGARGRATCLASFTYGLSENTKFYTNSYFWHFANHMIFSLQLPNLSLFYLNEIPKINFITSPFGNCWISLDSGWGWKTIHKTGLFHQYQLGSSNHDLISVIGLVWPGSGKLDHRKDELPQLRCCHGQIEEDSNSLHQLTFRVHTCPLDQNHSGTALLQILQ